jgi:FkbM family methyltransferase
MQLILKLINFIFHLIYLFHKNKIVNFLNKKINPKIVFDVGAYRGKFGHSFINSKIYFFEPNIFSYNKIKKIKKNKYFNIGLGSKFDKKKFYISPNDSASSFNNKKKKLKDIFFSIFGQKIKETYIKIYPLNFYIKKYLIKNIDILKIDTEGYEKEVLKGISKKNFKKITYIVIEKTLDKNLYQDYSFDQIHRVLKKNNFILIKKFIDFLWDYEDLIYINKLKNK